jgi:hypothetical protein
VGSQRYNYKIRKKGYLPSIVGKQPITQIKEWLVILVELILPVKLTFYSDCIVPADQEKAKKKYIKQALQLS